MKTNNNKKLQLSYISAALIAALSVTSINNIGLAETSKSTSISPDKKAFLDKAKKVKVYPMCSKNPVEIQKEDYQKNFKSLRGLTGIYVNIDDIIKGAESRNIILSEDLKQTVIDKLNIAGMTLLDKEEIKLIQGQPELSVFAAYPKHLGPFKEGQPVIKYNESCCLASTWTSFSQGATILRDPKTHFKLSTWGEGHNTSDCSNLTDWYQATVIKTIDNFIETKISADADFEKQRKIDELKTTVSTSKSTNTIEKKVETTTCDILTPEYLELFDTDKSIISSKKLGKLDKSIKILKKCSHYNFIVETHSDSRSEIEYNKKLSLERAETVKNYLISKGINSSRFTTKAFGESKPLVQGNSDAVHVTNRRVVIVPVLHDEHTINK